MRGHEYARSQVKTHLQSTVPGRLGAIRTALAATTPANPAGYFLTDILPTDPALYPAVVIMSTAAPAMKRQSVQAAGQAVDFVVIYSIRVVVACRTDVAGGDEAASIDRDRLMLAVREALLAPGSFPDDFELLTQDIAEDTGAAAQDLRGRPLAAGQITCQVGVLETLAALPAPDALEESAVDVTGYGRDTDDITPN